MSALSDTPDLRDIAPASFKVRHYAVMMSFVLCVALPSISAALYLWRLAEDQFVSKAAFSVRQNETTADTVTALFGFGQNASTSDTDVIYDYLYAHDLISAVNARVNLYDAWQRPLGSDPLLTLSNTASFEDLSRYWSRMVAAHYVRSEGIISLEVRAFSAAESQMIMSAILDHSGALIERLSKISQEDKTAFAADQLSQSEARLKAARLALASFRSENNLIDPSADVEGYMGVIIALEQELAGALIEFDLLETNHPKADLTQRRITALRSRIAQEREKLGLGTGSYSEILRAFEALTTDHEFATTAYQNARASYEVALSEARRQSRYLAAHIEPTLPDAPTRPRRLLLWSALTVFLSLIWALAVLTAYAIKDRR